MSDRHFGLRQALRDINGGKHHLIIAFIELHLSQYLQAVFFVLTMSLRDTTTQ